MRHAKARKLFSAPILWSQTSINYTAILRSIATRAISHCLKMASKTNLQYSNKFTLSKIMFAKNVFKIALNLKFPLKQNLQKHMGHLKI